MDVDVEINDDARARKIFDFEILFFEMASQALERKEKVARKRKENARLS